MNGTSLGESLFHGRLRTSSNRLRWLGIAMVILGVAAILFPIFSTLVAALLVGWVFLISGIFLLVGSVSIHGTGPFFGALLLSLLSIAAGVFLLFNPLAGEIALTLLLEASTLPCFDAVRDLVHPPHSTEILALSTPQLDLSPYDELIPSRRSHA